MAHSNVFHVEQRIEASLRELDRGQAASLVRYFDQDAFRNFCKEGFEQSILSSSNKSTAAVATATTATTSTTITTAQAVATIVSTTTITAAATLPTSIDLRQACEATFAGLKSLSNPLPELKGVSWHYSPELHQQIVNKLWREVDVDDNNSLDLEEFILLTKMVWLESLKQMQGTKRVRSEHKEQGREIVNEYFDLLCTTVGGLERVAELRKLFERPAFGTICMKVFQELENEEAGRSGGGAKKTQGGSVSLDIEKALNAFEKIADHFPEDRPSSRRVETVPDFTLSSTTNNGAQTALSLPSPAAVFHLNSPSLASLPAATVSSSSSSSSSSPSLSKTHSQEHVGNYNPARNTTGSLRLSKTRLGIHSPHVVVFNGKITPSSSPQLTPIVGSSIISRSPVPSFVVNKSVSHVETANELATRQKSLQRVLQRLDVDHSGGLDKIEFTNVIKVIWLLQVYEDSVQLEKELALEKESAVASLIEEGLKELQEICGGDLAKVNELRSHFASDSFKEVCVRVFGEVDKDHSETIDKEECMIAFRIVMQRLPDVSQVVAQNGRTLVSVANELGAALLDQHWGSLDSSSDGELQLNEFTNAMKLIWIQCSLIVNGAARVRDTALKRQATIHLVEKALASLSASGVNGDAHAKAVKNAFETEAFRLECHSIFTEADTDKSDSIEKKECVEEVKKYMQKFPRLITSLASFHKSLDAFCEEVSAYIDSVWKILDWNLSGNLDFDEFCAVVKLVRIRAQEVISKAEGAEKLVELYSAKLYNTLPLPVANEIRTFLGGPEFQQMRNEALMGLRARGIINCDQKQASELFLYVMSRHKGLDAVLALLGNSLDVYARLTAGSVLRRFWPIFDVAGSGMLSLQELCPLIKIIYIQGAGLLAAHRPASPADALVEEQLCAFGQLYDQENWLRMLFAGSNFKTLCNEVFTSVDNDKSGTIDRAELNKAFEVILQWVLSKFPIKIDTSNPNNNIVLIQQQLAMIQQHAQQAISFAFTVLDSDKSGTLSRGEFANAVKLCFIHALTLTQPPQQRKRPQPVLFWQHGENDRRSKQERALKIVDHLLVELARVNEVQADFVAQLIQSPQFGVECQRIFLCVDTDRSQSIDQLELLQAFRILVQSFPGIQERVSNSGNADVALSDRIEKLGASLVLLIFDLVNSNPASGASSRLDLQDFAVAMKVMLLKLLLPDDNPGAIPL